MHLINDLYYWIDKVLFWGLVALRAWALFDCLTRKAAAFPAVGKLTKPIWVAILALGGFLGSYFPPQPVGLLSLITTVSAAVYLADVRPAVREITGGR
ncbi:DUF2516 family protein [Jatrophihabitans sp.]|uniref:DUF2516 family protein n=1 Tax=Jatrophihabitans sp. TaxID=1932789 RepID=UPI0030C78544|nr:hypothetical protein [Jatrophihabitans sp.]